MSLVCPQEAEQAHHPPGSRPHKPPLNPPATDQKIMLYKPTIAARDPPSVVTLLRCSREHPEWTTLLIGAAACPLSGISWKASELLARLGGQNGRNAATMGVHPKTVRFMTRYWSATYETT